MNDSKEMIKENQPELLRKFTDAPAAIIELVVRILEKIGFNISKNVKNEIGIILLLTTIYITGDLFKLSQTPPMVIFTLIVAYTVVDFSSDNSQKIKRFFRGITNAENIIKKIKEGTIPNAAEEISIATFDAEGIDNLLIELSRDGLLTYDIQNAIVNTQTLYPKNLRTIFNINSEVNLHEDLVLEILRFNGVKQKLTDEQIKHLATKYRKNNKIIATLLLNQPQSAKVIGIMDDENLKKLHINHLKYLEKHLQIDQYFDIIYATIKLVLVIIFIIVLGAFAQISPQIKVQSPEQFVIISFMSIIGTAAVLKIIYIKLRTKLRRYLLNKKINNVLIIENAQKTIHNYSIVPITQ